MIKPTVKRGMMLDFIPDKIVSASDINPNRIYNLYDAEIGEGDIIYMPTRELRLQDNWAVVFGLDLTKKHNNKFKIIVVLSEITYSKVQGPFLLEGLKFFQKISARNNIDFEILDEIPNNIGALIVDFNPLHPHPQPLSPQGRGECTPIYEIDSHNIVPARFISQKQEFSAATLRRKIYANIAEFLTEYPENYVGGQVCPPYVTEYPQINAVGVETPTYITNNRQGRSGIPARQHELLQDFITNKLDNYTEFKNDPRKDVTSGLSPYLHFGFIAAQRAALKVVKSSTSRENKEAFLEELIVRKELADNFCLYSPSSPSRTLSVPIAAKYFVDATGNCEFSALANCEFLDENNLNSQSRVGSVIPQQKFQPVSLRFEMAGIDLKTFSKWLLDFDSDRNVTTVEKIDGQIHLSTAYTDNGTWALKPLFDDAVAQKILDKEDTGYFQVFTIPGMPNSISFNCPRIYSDPEIDPLDTTQTSKALKKGRESIIRLANFCKIYFPGFKNAYVSNIADALGVRVSRRIKGKYIYTAEDLKSGKKFTNPILRGNYPIDIHSNKKGKSVLEHTMQDYELPIEALISADYDNLFIAGRCLSAEFEAQAALRIQPACFSMGEGVAKYIFSSSQSYRQR